MNFKEQRYGLPDSPNIFKPNDFEKETRIFHLSIIFQKFALIKIFDIMSLSGVKCNNHLWD